MRRLVALVVLAACQKGGEPEANHKLDFVTEPHPADVAALVRDELVRAKADHRQVLVYEGAPWCDPCVRFHEAAEAGALDAAFPDLRVLAFDADRDGDALAEAGYMSDYLPMFAVPADDGRATKRHIEGSVKGNAAIGDLIPRIRALLAPP